MNTLRAVGLIADTHGFVDPRITSLFANVCHILHGGDVGDKSVLEELSRLAPLTAVSGNTDSSIVLPQRALIHLYDIRFLLQHIVDPQYPAPEFTQYIQSVEPHIIVFGHTHRPYAGWVNGRLYVNPGSAGKRRWDTQRSVAVLHLEGQNPQVEFYTLPD
ncbi:MAG: metallophosphatase family protein [Verrucomicrobiae bacterium]|nr:metallophosphatase family protein [Verrucomicrobiae bacterium]